MQVTTLQKLLIEELRDLYSAEKQLSKALPRAAKKASSPRLRKAFEKHHAETEKHIERLEQVFEMLGEKARAKKCLAMEGLIGEVSELMKEDIEPDVLDAGLISAAQKIEHYEIASYGCVRTYASLLGNTKAAKLLQKTLDEEGKTDQALTQLAERINVEAINEEKDGSTAAAGRAKATPGKAKASGRTKASAGRTKAAPGRAKATSAKTTTSGRTKAAPGRAKTTTKTTEDTAVAEEHPATRKRVAKTAQAADGRRSGTRRGRRKLAPTRTEDNENYEAMMAEGTTTGTSRDTTGNDAQNALYSDALPRTNNANGSDVERQG